MWRHSADWGLARPDVSLSHCRAAHGLLAHLAENLLLQLGLTDLPEGGCGEGRGRGPPSLIKLTPAASQRAAFPCLPARPCTQPW